MKRILLIMSLLFTCVNYSMEEDKEQDERNQKIIKACVAHKDSEHIISIIEDSNCDREDDFPDSDKKLLLTILYNKEGYAQEAIKEGADVNKLVKPRLDMLKVACVLGRLEIVRMLLASGAHVNAKNKFGSTALMYAAIAGKFDIVKLLCESGADVTITDEDGDTAVTSAAMARYEEIEKYLSEKINSAEQRRKDNERTFLLSVKSKDPTQFEEFIKNRIVDINFKDFKHWTPLITAAFYNYPKRVQSLLEIGIKNIDEMDEYNQTALFYAAKKNNPESVLLLCQYGANVNHKPKDNSSLSIIQCSIKNFLRNKDSFDVIKILISYGATIDNDLISFAKISILPDEVISFLENDAFKLQVIHKDGVAKKVLRDKILNSTTLPEALSDLVLDYHASYDLPKEEIDKFFYEDEQFALL